jgi:hypothetical protein
MISKKVLGVVALLLVIVVLLFWFLNNGSLLTNSSKAFEFDGNLAGIDGNKISVQGGFIFQDDESKNNPAAPISVQILIDSETKITRTLMTLPTREELAKTDGQFSPGKLKQTVSTVDLSTLQNESQEFAIGISAKSNQNIAGKSTFTASELNYRTVKNP